MDGRSILPGFAFLILPFLLPQGGGLQVRLVKARRSSIICTINMLTKADCLALVPLFSCRFVGTNMVMEFFRINRLW
jgi:hypothetical protein